MDASVPLASAGHYAEHETVLMPSRISSGRNARVASRLRKAVKNHPYAFAVGVVVCVGVVLVLAHTLKSSSSVSLQASPETCKFVVLGDYGRNGTSEQKAVAGAMGKYCDDKECEFIVTVGDNFYDGGVETVHNVQFNSSFEHVYTADSLYVPWYPILGNHDHKWARYSYQLEYTTFTNAKRWNFPDRYYTKDFSYQNFTVRLIFIDTTVMIEDYWNDEDYDYKQMKGMNETGQMDWLRTQVRESKADWNIVFGHHPIYSASSHGDTKDIWESLLPVLVQENVDAYFSGHDHNMQYLSKDFTVKGTVKTFRQFVSGAGSDLDFKLNQDHPQKEYAKTFSGFAGLIVSRDQLVVEFINAKNGVEYRTSISRRA
eukprot:GILK01001063.1.p1 GENE.GILK01001063.1~~GILK01001063.1.p1  ORF type:complete len:372 (-),score=48.49 GILK01001063.1:188-1303(-)